MRARSSPRWRTLIGFGEAGVGLLAIAEGGVVVEHLDAEYRPRRRYSGSGVGGKARWARLDDAEVETQTDARSNTSAPNQQRLDALGGRMTEAHGLRDAYDQLRTRSRRVLAVTLRPGVDARSVRLRRHAGRDGRRGDRRPDRGLSDRIFDVSTTNGDAWYEFHVSGSAYDDDNGGGCTATITTVGVTFVRSNRHLPRESFERIVEAIADAVDARRCGSTTTPRTRPVSHDRGPTNLYAGPGFDNDTDD